jgi:hypothetical protein
MFELRKSQFTQTLHNKRHHKNTLLQPILSRRKILCLPAETWVTQSADWRLTCTAICSVVERPANWPHLPDDRTVRPHWYQLTPAPPKESNTSSTINEHFEHFDWANITLSAAANSTERLFCPSNKIPDRGKPALTVLRPCSYKPEAHWKLTHKSAGPIQLHRWCRVLLKIWGPAA